MVEPVAVTVAVEGDVDGAVLLRLADDVGLWVSAVYGKRGKPHLKAKANAYNQAARHSPWVILVDLNDEAQCGPELRSAWVPDPTQFLSFRVAVRTIEAWLMADAERFAGFLHIPASRVPQDVEALDDPKGLVVQLAQQSSVRSVREDMAPRPGSGRRTGPLYGARLVDFVTHASDGWRPDVAARRSDSLRRCLRDLSRLKDSVAQT